jgi:Uridine kinase
MATEWRAATLGDQHERFGLAPQNILIVIEEVDYPFARSHDHLKALDLTVFIDTPLDVAMARRILRDFENADAEAIKTDMRIYLHLSGRGCLSKRSKESYLL